MAARPVLGQKFEDDLERTYFGRLPGQLPAFFANVLPGGRLRSVIQRSLGLEGASDIELLKAVETDLPGALRLRAADDVAEFNASNEDGAEDGPATPHPFGLRFSLAGEQLKFSVLRQGDRFTIPAHNEAGDWIVKVALGEFPGLAENEYFVLEWARKCGFVVPEARLVPRSEVDSLGAVFPEGSSVLAIRRYDREGGQRIHQEDFNQVFGKYPRVDGTEKYESTFEQLGALARAILGEGAVREFMLRAVFVVGSGNNDAHLKNWSLVYADGIHPQWSPLYDQVATVAWPALDRQLALKLSGAREFGRITRESFVRLGRRLGMGDAEASGAVEEMVERMRATWFEMDRGGLDAGHQAALREHWARVPVLRGGDLFQRGLA